VMYKEMPGGKVNVMKPGELAQGDRVKVTYYPTDGVNEAEWVSRPLPK